MKIRFLSRVIVMLFAATTADAGNISKGSWAPTSCGTKPEAPIIEAADVESYNNSVAAINTWQQQARTYFECLVKEANTDNTTIADSANREQNKYRETLEKIHAAIKEAGTNLEQENKP